MIPLSQTLLLASYPQAQAGTALAMWAMTTLVAPVVGPLLGGWITDNISWPWIFYINVPVGIAAARGHLVDLPQARDADRASVPIDGVGLGLLVLWVGALQIMLDKGKELDWFHSTQIVALAVRRGGRLRVLPRLGADRGASDRRPAPVRAAQLLDRHAGAVGRLRRCSSATSCCCRCGCSSTWATPRRWPAWCWRRSACWRSCSRRCVGRNVDRVDPRMLATVAFVGVRAGAVHALALQHRRRLRHAADADDHPGRGDGVLLHPADVASPCPACRRSASRRPRACSTSRASPPARSAPRSRRRCGTAARRCTMRSWSSIWIRTIP